MRVVILGAGLLGVASAYYLAKDGHHVVVLDRQPEPARETSYANAGLLTPNHAFTWAGPGAPWRLLKSLWQQDAGLRFRPHMNGQLLDWGLRFLRHCTAGRHVANSLAKARLCFHSWPRPTGSRARPASTGIAAVTACCICSRTVTS